ncbi:MAG: HAMP domain-containing sensor histidine kinase [Patescibacteria group bacterium]
MTDVYRLVETNRIYFGVYHDLANVLTGLNLSIANIKDFCDKEKILEISKRAVFLSSFLKDSRIKKDDFCVFDLGEELKNILLIFNYYFVKYNISTVVKIEDNVFVLLDRLKLGQVIINIISNAIDSLKEKDSHRSLFLFLKAKNDFIFITIKDNGVGVEKDISSKIFEPFFSSKKSKDNFYCGLGLYLVKSIVEKDFGGRIKFKSEEGKGVSFTIKMPA